MDWGDVSYLVILLATLAIGPYIRQVELPSSKRLVCTLFGLGFTTLVSGIHIIHPLVFVAVNTPIILFVSKRYCHIVSFFFSIAYLIFFRSAQYFGLPEAPGQTNGAQMLLMLRLAGLAFEVHDAAKDPNDTLYRRLSFSDVFHYSFCYIGLLTGPYYSYKTYDDMLHAPYAAKAPCTKMLLKRMRIIPLNAALYVIGTYFFPLEYAQSAEIFQRSFWYRIWYMTPTFFNFRMRIYTGFALAECSCIAAGLGAYPTVGANKPGKGPTNVHAIKELAGDKNKLETATYDFETVHNIDEHGSEFVPTFREAMRHWNMTVQYWLAVNVHKRLPAKYPRVLLTMLVSAVWHGVYAGYYLCLLGVPLVFLFEGVFHKLYRQNATETVAKIYDWIMYFLRMQWFSYLGMAFLLLRVDYTVAYWQSIYFLYHVVLVVSYCAGLALLRRRPKSPRSMKVE